MPGWLVAFALPKMLVAASAALLLKRLDVVWGADPGVIESAGLDPNILPPESLEAIPNPLNVLAGEAIDCVVFAVWKRLPFKSCDLFKPNIEPELAPVPIDSVGGGPAGVVDVPNEKFALGLLVGVEVSAWPEVPAVVFALPKSLLSPVLLPPPNILAI